MHRGLLLGPRARPAGAPGTLANSFDVAYYSCVVQYPSMHGTNVIMWYRSHTFKMFQLLICSVKSLKPALQAFLIKLLFFTTRSWYEII